MFEVVRINNRQRNLQVIASPQSLREIALKKNCKLK